MSFVKDNARGQIGEAILTNILEQVGFEVAGVDFQRRLFWDLEAWIPETDCILTFEVKYNAYAVKSGNIAIEFYNSQLQKPAGIMATKADFWCQIIPTNPQKILVITVSRLKYILDHMTPLRTVYNAGDGNADIMLFKLDKIKSEFKDFANMDDEDIRGYIHGI